MITHFITTVHQARFAALRQLMGCLQLTLGTAPTPSLAPIRFFLSFGQGMQDRRAMGELCSCCGACREACFRHSRL